MSETQDSTGVQPPATPETEGEKPKHSHRRTGTIARLPSAMRDQLNQMLLDGVPYKQIIDRLGDGAAGVEPDHITEWKPGGFQEWLLDQRRAADLRARCESALTLVREKAGATIQDASRTVASAQLHELLLSFDPSRFAVALAEKPELYFRLLQAVARLSEREAYCSRSRTKQSLIERRLDPSDSTAPVIPADDLKYLTRLIKLL